MLLCLDAESARSLHRATLPADVLSLLATAAATLLSYLEISLDSAPSTLLAIYFLAVSLCDIVRTRTAWIAHTSSATASVQTALLCMDIVVLVLESVRRPACDHSATAEERCGVWERSLMTWLLPLVKRGYRKNLMLGDLPNIDRQLASVEILPRFETAWARGRLSPKVHTSPPPF